MSRAGARTGLQLRGMETCRGSIPPLRRVALNHAAWLGIRSLALFGRSGKFGSLLGDACALGRAAFRLRAGAPPRKRAFETKQGGIVDCIQGAAFAQCISRESNPGHIDGDDVFCHYTTDASSAGERSQHLFGIIVAGDRRHPSDTEGIRTPAGRAQWISSPSP